MIIIMILLFAFQNIYQEARALIIQGITTIYDYYKSFPMPRWMRESSAQIHQAYCASEYATDWSMTP